jgi:DNA-binding NtrC family response regulator
VSVVLFENHQQRIFDLMGHSVSIQQIHQKIQLVARTNFTVIVEGETGTGKELVARLIHEQSDRAAQPFVAIDCGAIPESLVESELFGYVRGAFTGAQGKKAGYFELAKGGTLFLDEIANLSQANQMKLLRSLQERRVFPLGSEQSIPIDVRIIVASNAILEEEVQAGRFRGDLFHRLNEFKIYLLSLRQRKEDIPFLADRYRQETNLELGKNVAGFCPEALEYLLEHPWPGNVRELRNVVRRAVLLSPLMIELKHVRPVLSSASAFASAPQPLPQHLLNEQISQGRGLHDIIHEAIGHLEKTVITRVLQEVSGNKSRAARRLQISYKTLCRKVEEHGLDCGNGRKGMLRR